MTYKRRQNLQAEQATLNAKLNAPQLIYQQNLKAIEIWEAKLSELTGTPKPQKP